MTHINKLFKELRKQHYIAVQRVADCRSCSEAKRPDVEVYTITQSYGEHTIWIYFRIIEGTIIKEICDEFNIPYEWNGSDRTAFKIPVGKAAYAKN